MNRTLASEQIERLIEALPEDQRALWTTAFYAGLRRGELRALRWKDVDLANDFIAVRRSWDDVVGEQSPKSEAGIRDVLILPVLAQRLAAHSLATGRDGDDLVFGKTATEPFPTSSIDRQAKKAWAEAGLEPTTLHTARHCAASIMVAAGLDPKTVQTYLGHSDLKVTMDIYAHVLPGRHREAAEIVAAFLASHS